MTIIKALVAVGTLICCHGQKARSSTIRPTVQPSSAQLSAGNQSSARGNLTQVASFPHQVTGVTVSPTGRIFVNFPRWNEDVPISVAEVQNGSIVPYPNSEWNSWRNVLKPNVSAFNHFVCVQSVVADKNFLWVLDPASPGNERTVEHGPKLVKINLNNNRVTQIINFNDTEAPPSSYLNDVRFSPDGRYAYITDSGKPGLVVVDLRAGRAYRRLDNDTSVRVEPGVIVHTDGRELRRPDGRSPEFSSDGITLSRNGTWLYWQALTGKTLYRIRTNALTNWNLNDAQLSRQVERFAPSVVADGLWTDLQDRVIVTSPEDNSVKRRDGQNWTTLVQDARLRWPDTLSQGPDGKLYVTASHIQDSPWFQPTNRNFTTELWSFVAA